MDVYSTALNVRSVPTDVHSTALNVKNGVACPDLDYIKSEIAVVNLDIIVLYFFLEI